MDINYFTNQIKNCKSIDDLYIAMRDYSSHIAYRMGKYVEENWDKVTLEQWNNSGFYINDQFYGVRKNKSNPITYMKLNVDWDGDLILKLNDFNKILTTEEMAQLYRVFKNHYKDDDTLNDEVYNNFLINDDKNMMRLEVSDYEELLNERIIYDKKLYDVIKYKKETNQFIIKNINDDSDIIFISPFDIFQIM